MQRNQRSPGAKRLKTDLLNDARVAATAETGQLAAMLAFQANKDHEVRGVKGHSVADDGERSFEILFAGFDDSDSSWLKEEDCGSCQQIIIDYLKNLKILSNKLEIKKGKVQFEKLEAQMAARKQVIAAMRSEALADCAELNKMRTDIMLMQKAAQFNLEAISLYSVNLEVEISALKAGEVSDDEILAYKLVRWAEFQSDAEECDLEL